MQTETSKRGGKREPLPRMTITISNYGRYQEPLKKGRRVWVRFDRATPNDAKISRMSWEARGIFYSLVMVSSEGILADVTFADLGRMINGRPQTIKTVVGQLENEGLLLVEVKREANAGQTPVKRTANAGQTPAFEQSANDAGRGPLQTDRQTDIKTKAKSNPIGSLFFGDFWAASTKIGSKVQAAKIWERDNLDAEHPAIMAGLAKAMAGKLWQDGYKHHITTFLSQRLWESEWQPASKLAATDAQIADTVAELAGYGFT